MKVIIWGANSMVEVRPANKRVKVLDAFNS